MHLPASILEDGDFLAELVGIISPRRRFSCWMLGLCHGKVFGGGQRICMGQKFAVAEMKIVVAKLLKRFQFIATPATKLKVFPGDLFMLGYPDFAFKVEERNK